MRVQQIAHVLHSAKCNSDDIANSSLVMQLHGDGARASVVQLSKSLQTIYVMQSNAQGLLQTTISPEQERAVDWVLVDGLEGGRCVSSLTLWTFRFPYTSFLLNFSCLIFLE